MVLAALLRPTLDLLGPDYTQAGWLLVATGCARRCSLRENPTCNFLAPKFLSVSLRASLHSCRRLKVPPPPCRPLRPYFAILAHAPVPLPPIIRVLRPLVTFHGIVATLDLSLAVRVCNGTLADVYAPSMAFPGSLRLWSHPRKCLSTTAPLRTFLRSLQASLELFQGFAQRVVAVTLKRFVSASADYLHLGRFVRDILDGLIQTKLRFERFRT